MTPNDLATLCHPVIDRLTEENDHQAAILMRELVSRLQGFDRAWREHVTKHGSFDDEIERACREAVARAGKEAYDAGFKREGR